MFYKTKVFTVDGAFDKNNREHHRVRFPFCCTRIPLYAVIIRSSELCEMGFNLNWLTLNPSRCVFY